jgi:hypothetical protein
MQVPRSTLFHGIGACARNLTILIAATARYADRAHHFQFFKKQEIRIEETEGGK